MEAQRLKNINDLFASSEERIELINGEIVKRPMARAEHALVQSGLSDEMLPFRRRSDETGWWIMTECAL